jgi:hypothetical protein
MGLELPVDLIDESLPDVLEARLLSLRVRVGKSAQPYRPGIAGQLVSLLVREFAEERKTPRSPIRDSDGDLLQCGGEVDCESAV